MPCKLCAESGGTAHSFQKLGTLQDGQTNIFYTSPRRALIKKDTPDNVDNYIEHLKDTSPNPWIWIFDAKDMKTNDFISNGSGKKVINVMQETYGKTLKCVYIVNPTTPMRIFLGLMRPFMQKEMNARVYMCSLGLIEMVNKLQEVGINGADLATVVNLVT